MRTGHPSSQGVRPSFDWTIVCRIAALDALPYRCHTVRSMMRSTKDNSMRRSPSRTLATLCAGLGIAATVAFAGVAPANAARPPATYYVYASSWSSCSMQTAAMAVQRPPEYRRTSTTPCRQQMDGSWRGSYTYYN